MAKEEFRLHNSMTKEVEIFKPLVEGKVGMYVCGVTAYDYSHIGHARAYIAFDVLYRYLKHLNFEVTYVRNFTDVDDKIIERANKEGQDPVALSGKFCQEFLKDMDDLNCLVPTEQPRVSEHMVQIQNMIAKIIENGYAYQVEGDVYFSVDQFPDYGKLSGRKLEDNRAGERVAVDSRKKNPADFALWKAAKPGEPKWESPWGPGRPGWHIECSAMSEHYLTHSFDIHGGGNDLIFPHHENELSQSCAAHRESHVSYWVHNGFVNVIADKKQGTFAKMSKSAGNFFTIREVTKLYHPLALRYFLMKSHYRSAVNYSIAEIEESSQAVFYMYQTLQGCEDAQTPFKEETQQEQNNQKGKKAGISKDVEDFISKLRSEFQTKMSNDMHAGDILTGILNEALTLMNSSLTKLKKKKQKQEQLLLSRSLKELEKEVKQVLSILGLLPDSAYSEVLRDLKEKALTRAGLTEEEVEGLIEERALVRKTGDYARSDQMRSELLSKGIQLNDEGKLTIWIPCIPPPSLEAPNDKVPTADVKEQESAS